MITYKNKKGEIIKILDVIPKEIIEKLILSDEKIYEMAEKIHKYKESGLSNLQISLINGEVRIVKGHFDDFKDDGFICLEEFRNEPFFKYPETVENVYKTLKHNLHKKGDRSLRNHFEDLIFSSSFYYTDMLDKIYGGLK